MTQFCMRLFFMRSENDLGAFKRLQCNTTFHFERGLHGVVGFEQYTWGCRVRDPKVESQTSQRRSEGRVVENSTRPLAASTATSEHERAGSGVARGSPAEVTQGTKHIRDRSSGLLSKSARGRGWISQVDNVQPDIDHGTQRTRTEKANSCGAGQFAPPSKTVQTEDDPDAPPVPVMRDDCKLCPQGTYAHEAGATVCLVPCLAMRVCPANLDKKKIRTCLDLLFCFLFHFEVADKQRLAGPANLFLLANDKDGRVYLLCKTRRASRAHTDSQAIRMAQPRSPTAAYNKKMLGSTMIVPTPLTISLVRSSKMLPLGAFSSLSFFQGGWGFLKSRTNLVLRTASSACPVRRNQVRSTF